MGAFPYTPDSGLTRVGLGRPNMAPIVWYDDFIAIGTTSFSATQHGAPYLLTGTNAATTASTNIQSLAAANGKLKILTAATSGDEQFVRLSGTPFTFNSSTTDPRPMEAEFNLTIDTITTSNQACGWHADFLTTTDPVDTQGVGAFFVIASGALQYCYKTSAVTVAPTAFSPAVAVVAAQVITLKVTWDGIDTLRFIKDGNVLLTVGLATFTSTAVTPFFGIDTASAVAKALTIDWGYMGQEAAKAGRS